MKLREKPNKQKFVRSFLLPALFCFLLLPFDCPARTLGEYRAGVAAAKDSTDGLIDYVDDALASGEGDAAAERELLAGIRRSLPATEKVEWEGTSIETGNQWLEAKLAAFEEETADWEKRRQILTEIGERLAALEEKIAELEAPVTTGPSKDEYKRKLAEIQRRPEFQKPEQQQESWFERLQRKIKEWFDQKFPQPEVPQGAPEGLKTISLGLQILLYVLILGFIGFIVYRFAPFFAARFRRDKREEKGERVILGEKLAADEDAQTLFGEAEALARGGNLRGAIRKGYIALLCELSDRKIIGLAQHKTNRDYLRDVRKKGALHQNMNGLTTSFERYWYGFENPDEGDWNEFKQIYQKALGGEK